MWVLCMNVWNVDNKNQWVWYHIFFIKSNTKFLFHAFWVGCDQPYAPDGHLCNTNAIERIKEILCVFSYIRFGRLFDFWWVVSDATIFLLSYLWRFYVPSNHVDLLLTQQCFLFAHTQWQESHESTVWIRSAQAMTKDQLC